MTNFIIDLEYVAPLEQIEPHMDGHMRYIDDGNAKELFITWGPKVPRTGGVIVAQSDSLNDLVAFCNTDPFITNKLAKMTITEFIGRRPISQSTD